MLIEPFLFKLAGISALLGGGAYSVYAEYARDNARMCRMDALVALVRYIRVKIDRYLTPIGDIFRQCDSDIIDGCFIGVKERGTERPRDMAELVSLLRNGEFFEDGREALCALAQSLGRSRCEETVRECDECIRELEEIRHSLVSELPKKRKTRAVVGLCIGAAAVIIII